MSYWFLRLHRWLALTFSLPIAIVLLSGLVLSFEPLFLGNANNAVSAASILAALEKHDPGKSARFLSVNSFAGTISFGTSPRSATIVNLNTNEKLNAQPFPAQLFSTSRRIHEALLLDLGWLVSLSTFALVAIIALGVLMGLPMLRNNLSGWHKATAWFALPLLILSPVTGLLLAFGVSFAPLPQTTGAVALSLPESVEVVTAKFSASQIVWIRTMRGNQMTRIADDGELRVFQTTKSGLIPAQRNWPRLLHEGTWSRLPAFVLNIVKSFALAALLFTGVWIWLRKRKRRRRTRPARTS